MSGVKRVEIRYKDTRHCPHIGRGPINQTIVVPEVVYLSAKALGYKVELVEKGEAKVEAPEPKAPTVKEKVKTEEKMVKSDLPEEPKEQELTSRIAKINGIKHRVWQDKDGKTVKAEPLEEPKAEEPKADEVKVEAPKADAKVAPKTEAKQTKVAAKPAKTEEK